MIHCRSHRLSFDYPIGKEKKDRLCRAYLGNCWLISMLTSLLQHAVMAFNSISLASGNGFCDSLAGIFSPLPIVPECKVPRTELSAFCVWFIFINDTSLLLEILISAGVTMSFWAPNRLPYIYNAPSNNSLKAAIRVYFRVAHSRASNASDRLM